MKKQTSLFDFAFGESQPATAVDEEKTHPQPDFAALLAQGEQSLTDNHTNWQPFSLHLSSKAEALRWFVLPQHCFTPDPNNGMSEVA